MLRLQRLKSGRKGNKVDENEGTTMRLTNLIVILSAFMPFQGAFGQNQGSMSQLLNQVDQPNVWQRVPVSAPQQPMQGQGMPSNPGNVAPINSAPVAPNASQSPYTLMNIFKTMMGGGPGGGRKASPQDVQSAIESAREDLQTARDQEAQARDANGSIGGESDRGVKQGLAEQARDHASAAREAADRAYETSGRFPNSELSDIASEARGAADEAQAAADRASARASGGGW
jgi:hypothetical protein